MLPFEMSHLAGLVTATASDQIVKDLLVVGHLAALAVGLGTVICTDSRMFRQLWQPFTRRDLQRLTTAHRTIGLALAVLWGTGLGLFLLKTGGDLGAASPKLVTKLMTVSWLSLTALGMSSIGLPILAEAVGRPLAALPTGRRATLAVFAGMSVAGWGLSLILGAAGTTYAAEWPALQELFLLTHGGAVTIAVLGALAIGRSRAARQDVEDEGLQTPDLEELPRLHAA